MDVSDGIYRWRIIGRSSDRVERGDQPVKDVSHEAECPQSDQGKVVGVQKGQTTGHVRIDIGNGVIVTSSITNEAIDDLGLAVGDDAIAVIKASDVMVAK